jgi:hypothetical protein
MIDLCFRELVGQDEQQHNKLDNYDYVYYRQSRA